MKKLKFMITTLALASISLLSCEKLDNLIPENKGRLNVHLTDAPFPIDLIGSTQVTIDGVEIRKKIEHENGAEMDSFLVVSNETANFNLLELTNGVSELLATIDLDPGYYDMIRLHVVDATITMKDGTTFDLDIPSGDASGLKILLQPAVYIEAGKIADVLLDFDVSRSFIVKGNIKGKINGFIFKPVVRAIFMKYAGSIEGQVTDTSGVPIENAMVQVFIPDDDGEIDEEDPEEGNENGEMKSGKKDKDNGKDDDCDKGPVSSFTDESGQYKIIGLPEGTYTMVCSYEGFLSDTITGVVVSAEAETTVNFELQANQEVENELSSFYQ